MDWRTAGNASAVAVQFLVDGEFVIPDTGSLTLTIRDNSGTAMAGYDHLALADVFITSLTLAVPQAINQITPGNPMETRYVSVAYSVGGLPLSFEYRYGLTPFLPIQVLPEDVRSLLGVSEKELPDRDIDLVYAYFKLGSDVGANFTTALTSTNRASLCANNMIALQAAILLVPSLQNRIMKSETSHAEIFIRNKLDITTLQNDLVGALTNTTTEMNDILSGIPTSLASTPIFFLTSPTDVITGA